MNNAEDVNVIRHLDLLQDSVQRDERPRPPNARATMHDNRARFRSDSLAESSDEASKRLGWIWHTEIWPRCEMEVTKNALNIALGKLR